MKALSIFLEYALEIRNGEKWYEGRSWTTSHRGPLLICASKETYRKPLRCIACGWMGESRKRGFDIKLVGNGWEITRYYCPICKSEELSEGELPLLKRGGCALAIVDVVDIEGEKGDYAWVLDYVQPIDPFQVSGRRGLYEVIIPADLEKLGDPIRNPYILNPNLREEENEQYAKEFAELNDVGLVRCPQCDGTGMSDPKDVDSVCGSCKGSGIAKGQDVYTG